MNAYESGSNPERNDAAAGEKGNASGAARGRVDTNLSSDRSEIPTETAFNPKSGDRDKPSGLAPSGSNAGEKTASKAPQPAAETAESIAAKLCDGTLRAETLDLTEKMYAVALLNALGKKPSLAAELDGNRPGTEDVLLRWIAKTPDHFIEIPKDRYTEKLASAFLYEKLRQSTEQKDIPVKFFVLKSFNEKPIVVLRHKTFESEEIAYFDEDIEMPTKIACSITAKLKINNVLRFLEALDVAVGLLDGRYIADFFDSKIQSYFRKAFSDTIVRKKIGYFHIAENLDALTERIRSSSRELSENGVALIDLKLNSVEIPNNTNELLEEQYYLTRKKESEFRICQMEADLALKNYEQRAEIHTNYPNFAEKLKEGESDFLLTRYLVPHEFDESDSENFARKKLDQKKDYVLKETKIAKIKPVEPVKPQKKTLSAPAEPGTLLRRIGFIPFTIFAAAILGGILIAALTEAAVAGIVLLVFVVIGGAGYFVVRASKYKKEKSVYEQEKRKFDAEFSKNEKAFAETYAEYEKRLRAYETELAEFNAEAEQ